MSSPRVRLHQAITRVAASRAHQSLASLESAVAALTAESHRVPDVDPCAGPLGRVAEYFGLDEVDQAILYAAAAPDLDGRIGPVYAALRGDLRATALTTEVALDLVEIPSGSAEALARFGPRSLLLRGGLAHLEPGPAWLQREIRVPESVLMALVGGYPEDPEIDAIQVRLRGVEVPGSATVTTALEQGRSLVWIRSRHGMAGPAMAAEAFGSIGVHHLAIDLARHRGPDLAALVFRAARQAALLGWGLVVLGAERAEESPELVDVLAAARVPVIAVSSLDWNTRWSAAQPVTLDAPALPLDARARLWAEELAAESADTSVGHLDDEMRETVSGFRLGAEDIVRAAGVARSMAQVTGRPVDVGLVRDAVRSLGGSGIAASGLGTGRRTGSRAPSFGDLVLPEHVEATLKRFVGWARQRDAVRAEGMLQGRGRGLAALFTGNPGTGKTLAANVIAAELGIELFQVDLSSIVDKYIGETEKNLERVFQAAESMDVVLFFDEADALFGARSGVQDARDRYANQEVAYLLQRMEQFDGITVLSTNLRGNLDKAFSRRMSAIVQFPDPDPATRERLWRHHLDHVPDHDASDPVDGAALAAVAELAGGDIRNVVMAAALDAATEEVPLGQRHVVASVVREYNKLGRLLPNHPLLRG